MSTPVRRTFLRLALLRLAFLRLAFLGLAQGAIAAASIWAASADAQERSAVTIFENVRIFDGTHLSLSAPSNVLIKGNIIEQISTSPIPTDRRADTQIIAGGGRVLMPGLSDAHWHAMFAGRLKPRFQRQLRRVELRQDLAAETRDERVLLPLRSLAQRVHRRACLSALTYAFEGFVIVIFQQSVKA